MSVSYKAHYSRFLGAHPGRLHFAAHSHHPWPDVTREAMLAYWDDAARLADRKWDHVFGTVVPRAQAHIARIEPLGNGHMRLTGTGTANATYRILATPTLTQVDWQEIGTMTAGPDGVWEYTDTAAPGFTIRFYLVKWP